MKKLSTALLVTATAIASPMALAQTIINIGGSEVWRSDESAGQSGRSATYYDFKPGRYYNPWERKAPQPQRGYVDVIDPVTGEYVHGIPIK